MSYSNLKASLSAFVHNRNSAIGDSNNANDYIKSDEFIDIAKEYWTKSGCDKKIELIIRDANESLDEFINKGMNESFDFIFIDADKNNYLEYYKKSLELVRCGGMILIDNTMWKGKVVKDNDMTNSTRSIKALNDFIASDDRVDHCLLTIYDGLTLCIKK